MALLGCIRTPLDFLNTRLIPSILNQLQYRIKTAMDQKMITDYKDMSPFFLHAFFTGVTTKHLDEAWSAFSRKLQLPFFMYRKKSSYYGLKLNVYHHPKSMFAQNTSKYFVHEDVYYTLAP